MNKIIKDQIIKLGLDAHAKGKLIEASKYYKAFINKGLKDRRVFSNYGIILKEFGRLEESEILLLKAIEIDSNFALGYYNLGIIYLDLNKISDAEKVTRRAIEIDPNLAIAHFSLGNIFREKGDLKDAETSTRQAIKLKPDFAEAFINLGTILKDLGETDEAELMTLESIKLNPKIGRAYNLLGLILLRKGQYNLSLNNFYKSAEVLRGKHTEFTNELKFKTISRAKIQHDIEQFEYLVSKGYETEKFSSLTHLYKKVENEIDWPSETKLITLSPKHQNLLRESYNRIIHRIETPRLNDSAVNKSLNIEKITNDYFKHSFGLTHIDNFLNNSALEALRKFFLGSTIWFDIKGGGYIGAYLREGLANPLLIQIAEELRNDFPKIFKDYYINEIWAYKYDSRAKNPNSSLSGINVHADFAAINVNFWITPSEANLNPKSGGLIVYDVEAPKEWNFNSYNNDIEKIKKELKRSKGETKAISYKGNRAVVFNSNLFHETDTYTFKEGYENRRINVTMLFGNRKDQ